VLDAMHGWAYTWAGDCSRGQASCGRMLDAISLGVDPWRASEVLALPGSALSTRQDILSSLQPAVFISMKTCKRWLLRDCRSPASGALRRFCNQ